MNEIYVNVKLLQVAAEIARQWHSDDEETKKLIRNDFAEFAKPYWMQDGESLVAHMMNKYVNNDEESIVEHMYNLDENNREIVVKYLLYRLNNRLYGSDFVVVETNYDER